MGKKEYNYEYDAGKVVRATECSITLNANEIVTTKAVVNKETKGDKGTVLLSPFFIDIIHLLCYSKLG